MKTRLLIIIGIIVVLTISIGVVLWPEYGMVCNNAVVEHLQKYSNLFDDNITYDTYGIKEIGLPFGVHPGNLQECVDFILEKRTSIELEPEVTDSLKIPNAERDTKLAAGYNLYPGVGWVHPDDLGNTQPIYRDNPDNSGELILDIDAMIQVQKILDKCDYVQKLESGKIPWENPDGSFNVIHGDLPFFNNGTHYIDSDICKWIDSFESITYNCFESTPIEQNWYSGPAYFYNDTHHIDVQYCEWTVFSEEYLELPLCDPNPEHNFGKCKEFQ